MNKEIGKRISDLRKSMDMNKEQFAKLIGISGQYLGTVEAGVHGLSLDSIITLCENTNVSADYILFGKEHITVYVKGMRLVAEDAGDAKTHLTVILSVYYLHFALSTGALKLYHIACESKKSHKADNSRAAVGTAVCNRSLFLINNHNNLHSAALGITQGLLWGTTTRRHKL